MRRRLRATAGALLAALALAACGTGPPANVRIGLVAPLTGPRAYLGTEVVDGAELAVEDLNRRGGLLGRPVELVVVDDADLVRLPGQLADLAEQRRVSAVIGPEVPDVLLGPRSPLTRRGVPAILPTAFTGDLAEASTFVARTIPPAAAQARALGTWLAEERGVTRLALLLVDPLEGAAARRALVGGLADAGIEVVATVAADPDAPRLEPAVDGLRADAVAAGGAGAVLLWGPPPAAARATLAVRAVGWDDVQVTVGSSAFVSEYRVLAGPAAEGVVLPFPFRPEWFTSGELASVLLRYHRAHGLGAIPRLDTVVLDVPVLALAAYDAVGLVAAAVEEARSREPERVADALGRVEHEGLLTTYDLGRARDREVWVADDLRLARFHNVATVFDVDPRTDPRAQRVLYEAQVTADFVPDALGGGLSDLLTDTLAAAAREAPTYVPPAPAPGPVGGPGAAGARGAGP
ncbi:MAG: ABC transporter substrate-binding protein [Actinomycetes bacterium]